MGSENYFKEVANKWDTMRKDFFPVTVREKALNIAEVTGGKTAADIGCGTGFLSEALIERGLKVIAIDRSEEMLIQMKEKYNGSGDIDYRQGDAESLPVEDNSVDYAMANMYLHHVDSPHIAIKEMVRILKPGGKLVITDLDLHNFDFLRVEHHDRWMGFDRADVESWFTQAGLKDVRIDCAGGNCCATSSCSCEDATISIFAAIGTK